MDVRARTHGYSETIRARSTRCICATVKHYARLAWVYLWSLERVSSLKPPANVGWRGRSCMDFILKTTIAVPPNENQTAAMLKSQLKADWKALEWNREPGDSYECPSFLKSEKAACALCDMRVGWSAPKAIRWPAPSSERAGLVRRGYNILMTPIRSITVSDVPLPHNWSYHQCSVSMWAGEG